MDNIQAREDIGMNINRNIRTSKISKIIMNMSGKNILIGSIATLLLAFSLAACGKPEQVSMGDLLEDETGSAVNEQEIGFDFSEEQGKFVDALEIPAYMTATGENFHIDIDAEIICPDVKGMKILSMKRSYFSENEEKEIVGKFFDFSKAEEYKGEISGEFCSYLIDFLGLDAMDIPYDIDDVSGNIYFDDVSIPGWSEFSGAIVHTYHGERDGVPYEMLFGYEKSTGKGCLYVKVISYEDMYPEYAEGLNLDVEGLVVVPGGYDSQSSGLESSANAMKLPGDDKAITDDVNELLNIFGMKNFDLFNSEEMTLVRRDLDTYTDEALLVDGYGYHMYYNDLSLASCSLFIPDNNYSSIPELSSGQIFVSSRGLLYGYFYRNSTLETGHENYVKLLSLDQIKSIIHDTLVDNVDPKELDGNSIKFDKLALCYYHVMNEEDSNQFEYVPCWILYSSDLMHASKCSVIINAVNGDIVETLY